MDLSDISVGALKLSLRRLLDTPRNSLQKESFRIIVRELRKRIGDEDTLDLIMTGECL